MLFQIIGPKRSMAIDVDMIDLIQLEDSGDLAANDTDRYALCFYRLGQEQAASYPLGGMPLAEQVALFEQACKAKNTHEAQYAVARI